MREWAVNLIFCVLVMILLGYFTPEGKYEKQIKLACSVLFVAAIFIPAVEFIRGENFNEAFLKTSLTVDAQLVGQSYSASSEIYNKTLIKSYNSDLERSLKSELAAKTGFDGEIDITINEDTDDETFGQILKVDVVSNKTLKSKDNLRNLIINFYSVSSENINITVKEEQE